MFSSKSGGGGGVAERRAMPPLCRPPGLNKPTATAFCLTLDHTFDAGLPQVAEKPPSSPAGYRSGAATSVAATFQPDTLITGTAPCRSAES